jgi:hypothetical protein
MKAWAIILAATVALLVAASASPSAVRPDDRAGVLGVGQAGLEVQADQSDVISRYLISHASSIRPDDRAAWRGVGPQPLVVAEPTATGMDWGDLGWGVLIGAGAMLAVLAVGYAGRNRIHRPHFHRPHFHRPHFHRPHFHRPHFPLRGH